LHALARVCDDNPFLDNSGIAMLIDEFKKKPVDYLIYRLNNEISAIQSHSENWAEVVSLETRKQAAE